MFFRKILNEAEGTFGPKKTLLGFDRKLGVFHTQYTDSVVFLNFLANLKSLKKEDYDLIKKEKNQRLPENVQQRHLGLLKAIRFVPPFFAQQSVNPDTFAILPRESAKLRTKNISGISKDVPLPQFFANLLRQNDGIFLGHRHDTLKEGLVDLLIDQMDNLYNQGLRHIYEELSAAEFFPDFEKFNNDPSDNGDELKKNLISHNSMYVDERMKLYLAAKAKGIKILPIDCRTQNETLDRRLKIGNGGMVRNSDHFSSDLQNGEKFIALCGLGHHQVAQELGIPSILVDHNTEEVLHVYESDPKSLEIAPDPHGNRLKLSQQSVEDNKKTFEAYDFCLFYKSGYRQKEIEIYKGITDLHHTESLLLESLNAVRQPFLSLPPPSGED